MADLSTLSDSALAKLQQTADKDRLAAKLRAQEVVKEIDRRANEARLRELAKSVSAEDAARIAEIHQTLKPEGIDASATFGTVGGVKKS